MFSSKAGLLDLHRQKRLPPSAPDLWRIGGVRAAEGDVHQRPAEERPARGGSGGLGLLSRLRAPSRGELLRRLGGSGGLAILGCESGEVVREPLDVLRES